MANRKFIKSVVIILAILISLLVTYSFSNNNSTINEDDYPVPANENILFYIQHSHNTNTVVYESNYDSNGKLQSDKPLKVYWIRYAENGQFQDLSSAQRNLVYGINSRIYSKEKKWYLVNIRAYSKLDIYLKNSTKNNRYHAYTTINGKSAELTRIFVHTNGGTSLAPTIEGVEIFGIDSGGNQVTEYMNFKGND